MHDTGQPRVVGEREQLGERALIELPPNEQDQILLHQRLRQSHVLLRGLGGDKLLYSDGCRTAVTLRRTPSTPPELRLEIRAYSSNDGGRRPALNRMVGCSS